MKLLAPFLLGIGLGAPTAAAMEVHARASSPAAGIAIGLGLTSSGSGLTLAQARPHSTFIQGLIGFDWDRRFILNADYCFASQLAQNLDIYAGPGLTAREYGIGLRIPVGLLAQFSKIPLQIGAELAPTILANYHTWGFIDLGLYLRFILK